MVTMGRDLIILFPGYQRLAHVVEQSRPEQIRITIRGASFNGQSSVFGHITFGVVHRRLGSPGQGGEFWDGLNNTIPPTWLKSPKLPLNLLERFHPVPP
jgi:hypothetical protein